MIGSMLITGPGVSTPMRPPAQPQWKTAVVSPKVATMLSRKPSVATTGITSERNTSVRMMSESPTMMAM